MTSLRLEPGLSLLTCPALNTRPFQYIVVTVLDHDSNGIAGTPAGVFTVTVTGGPAEALPCDNATDGDGRIRFEVYCHEAVQHPADGGSPLQIYCPMDGPGMVPDVDELTCNTVDYDLSGQIGISDVARFAMDFSTTHERGDFNWDGAVNPRDFLVLERHWLHEAAGR
jgi:hypothetical protein